MLYSQVMEERPERAWEATKAPLSAKTPNVPAISNDRRIKFFDKIVEVTALDLRSRWFHQVVEQLAVRPSISVVIKTAQNRHKISECVERFAGYCLMLYNFMIQSVSNRLFEISSEQWHGLRCSRFLVIKIVEQGANSVVGVIVFRSWHRWLLRNNSEVMLLQMIVDGMDE